MPATFPADWREQPCFLVSVPAPLVQYVGGLLKILEKRGFWDTDDDYRNGYTAVSELEGCLMATCLNVLLEQNDALYRLLNTALFGVTYATVTTTPLVVTPAIAPHVTLDVHDENSLLGRIDRLTQLVDNTINGTSADLYSYTPSVKAQLQSIIDALGTENTDLSDVKAALVVIEGLLA